MRYVIYGLLIIIVISGLSLCYVSSILYTNTKLEQQKALLLDLKMK